MTIEISEEQSTAFKARAAAEGLSLENWLDKIAQLPAKPERLPYNFERGREAVARIREIQQRSGPDPEGLTVVDYLHRDRR